MSTESAILLLTALAGTLAVCARPIDEVRAEEHYNRGVNFLKAKRFELAMAEFQLSLELRPHEVDTHLNLGNALAGNRQFDDAISEWETCTRLDPNYARAYYNLATLYRTRGEYVKSLDYFKIYNGLVAIDHVEVQRIAKIMDKLRDKVRKTS